MGSNLTLGYQNKEQCRRTLTLQVRTQLSTIFNTAKARHMNVTKIPRFPENMLPTGGSNAMVTIPFDDI